MNFIRKNAGETVFNKTKTTLEVGSGAPDHQHGTRSLMKLAIYIFFLLAFIGSLYLSGRHSLAPRTAPPIVFLPLCLLRPPPGTGTLRRGPHPSSLGAWRRESATPPLLQERRGGRVEAAEVIRCLRETSLGILFTAGGPVTAAPRETAGESAASSLTLLKPTRQGFFLLLLIRKKFSWI